MAYFIGMNSGSSFDGIDVVLAETSIGKDGHPLRPKFIDGISYDWPENVAEIILKAFDNKVSIFELTRLNYMAGAVYAQAAKTLIDKLNLNPEDITVIGVDGQTIYQEPPNHGLMESITEDTSLLDRWFEGPYACGLQIGESAIISAHTKIPTVNHFRPADHALGGTGAPLMQYLDFVAFRDNASPVLTLNIGGISNCQLANADRDKMMAFDCGPGNVMIDHAAHKLFNLGYDESGRIAASGNVNREMLDELLTHPFFHREPPRSAWRLDFGSKYADKIIEKYSDLKNEDLMATLTAFTADAIYTSINDHIPNLDEIDELLASGGGVRNATLMLMIQEKFEGKLKLSTSDEYGIPSQYKEAIKFGILAFSTMNKIANNIPACSGANEYNILGKISYPPTMATGN